MCSSDLTLKGSPTDTQGVRGLVVFNPSSWTRTEVVDTEVTIPATTQIRVLDDTGSTDMITELTALQDAVNDGMNVINLSLGSVQLDLSAESGAEARAINNAVAAGVLVIAASGNSGPESGTIADPASSPQAIAVGANENDRYFDYAVLLGDLPPYRAQVPTALGDKSGRVTGNLLDAATTTNALGCSAFPAASLQDKIVLISRGTCSFDNKVNNAAKGGAAGVVIFNTNPTELLDMSLPTAKLPATFVALEAGLEMQSQLRAHPDISASIDFTGFTPIPASADVLSYFSGRGPTATGVIKPELTAVGNNIFTASTASDASYLPFTLGGGTSFAAPLVTGAAAVLMSARPGLQSADYRSLLINSSQAIRNSSGTTVDVLDGGAGRLDLSRALQNNLTVSPATLSSILNATDDSTIKTISITNTGTFTDTFVVTTVNGDTNAPYVDAGPFTLDPGQSQTVIVRISQMKIGRAHV